MLLALHLSSLDAEADAQAETSSDRNAELQCVQVPPVSSEQMVPATDILQHMFSGLPLSQTEWQSSAHRVDGTVIAACVQPEFVGFMIVGAERNGTEILGMLPHIEWEHTLTEIQHDLAGLQLQLLNV